MAFSRKYPVSKDADFLRYRAERPYRSQVFLAAIDQIAAFTIGAAEGRLAAQLLPFRASGQLPKSCRFVTMRS
jgi:hypothetical protein